MKREKEYLMLRDEITWRLKSIDTLGTYTYTIFISILGVALSTQIIELFLLPYAVILPMLLKVSNHKYSIGYLSGYLNEFLEDENDEDCFKWERLYVEYRKINKRTLKEKIVYYGASFEYIAMCALAAILFWIYYFNQKELVFSIVQIYGYIILQLSSIVFAAYITFSYISFQKIKPSILDKWKNVRK